MKILTFVGIVYLIILKLEEISINGIILQKEHFYAQEMLLNF